MIFRVLNNFILNDMSFRLFVFIFLNDLKIQEMIRKTKNCLATYFLSRLIMKLIERSKIKNLVLSAIILINFDYSPAF